MVWIFYTYCGEAIDSMAEITYEELRRIQSREREPGLSKLQEDFYEQAEALLSKYKNAKSISEHREYENILKILRYIFSRREEKILTASVNGLKGVEPPQTMLKGELDVYKKFSDLIRSDRDKFELLLCSGSSRSGSEIIPSHAKAAEVEEIREVKLPDKERIRDTGCFSLKVMREIDEFVGLDGKTYGPYKTGSEVVLPVKEAETLMKMKLAERLGMM